MALSNNTFTTTAAASAFLASLFAARSPVLHTDDSNEAAEITDWEFVNNSDLSDDDIIDILSDSEFENASTLISVSFVDNHGLKIDDQEYGSLAVVAIRPTHNGVAEEKKKASKQQQEDDDDEQPQEAEEDLDEEVEDPESDDDKNIDLDDELVPWSVSDRFGRHRMRKLGTRAFAKMNKTTKKIAYTANRPGCVRGKHGLGRRA